jgi:hypothetical protein
LPESEVVRIRETFEESNRSFFARFVRNGGAFPQNDTFRPADAEPFDTKAIADEMHALLVRWPQLRLRGWNKKAGSARRYFQEGWHVERDDGVVRKQTGPAIIRFRLADRKRSQWSTKGISVSIGVVGDPVAQHVDINGRSLGTLMIGADPINIDFDVLGELDQAEVTFTGVGSIEQFDLISMDVSMGEGSVLLDQDS